MIITTTVTKILGADDWASFCHSAIKESLLMIPILYLGMTVPIAFWECTAWSKETVALRPAFWPRTMGPPGCSVWYLVTSYTLSWMTIQRSSSVLCLATSSQSITFYDVIFFNILIFIIDLVILLSTNRTTVMIFFKICKSYNWNIIILVISLIIICKKYCCISSSEPAWSCSAIPPCIFRRLYSAFWIRCFSLTADSDARFPLKSGYQAFSFIGWLSKRSSLLVTNCPCRDLHGTKAFQCQSRLAGSDDFDQNLHSLTIHWP